jgi:hypothetical protein
MLPSGATGTPSTANCSLVIVVSHAAHVPRVLIHPTREADSSSANVHPRSWCLARMAKPRPEKKKAKTRKRRASSITVNDQETRDGGHHPRDRFGRLQRGA